MRPKKKIKILFRDLEKAIYLASKEHMNQREVKMFLNNPENSKDLWKLWKDGSWKELIKYRKLTKIGINGKERHIDSPNFLTRIFQHLWIIKARELYMPRDNRSGMNCKPRYGITAKDKKHSLLSRVKHVFYDRKDCLYLLKMDQRKCYEHITESIFRKEMRNLTVDDDFINFGILIGFVNGKLPIGTPCSPLIHHIVMLRYDNLARSMSKYYVRYADDILLFFESKSDAHSALWRTKFFWWYELGIRSKSGSIIQSTDKKLDFCGYIIFKNKEKLKTSHNKGFCKVRPRVAKRAMRSTNKNWGSYFGILKSADSFNLMINIESSMKLNKLIEKFRITRNLDAKNIDIKELVNKEIKIIDYEIRRDSKGNPNWIKFLIEITELDSNNNPTGKILCREFHGNFQGLYSFISLLEENFNNKQEFLPIEDAKILNQCGYIFEGSTNQLDYYFTDNYSSNPFNNSKN